MTNQYFHYIQNVLGVRSVLLPFAPTQHLSSCLFLTDEQQFTTEESELFLKMIAAMKLSENNFELIGFKESEMTSHLEQIQNAKAIVVLQQHLFDYLRVQFPHSQIFLVPHPKDMLINPSLKKNAWEELKKVISIIQ